MIALHATDDERGRRRRGDEEGEESRFPTVCVECGSIHDVTLDRRLERRLDRTLDDVATDHGFTLDGHSIELFRRCALCRTSTVLDAAAASSFLAGVPSRAGPPPNDATRSR